MRLVFRKEEIIIIQRSRQMSFQTSTSVKTSQVTYSFNADHPRPRVLLEPCRVANLTLNYLYKVGPLAIRTVDVIMIVH